MTRLEVLKKEKEIINNLQCLSFNLIEQCTEYYDREIKCIEEYDSANPDYEES